MKSVTRFFSFATTGMLASGFLAVAGSGYLDAAAIFAGTVALLLRAVLLLAGWRWPIPPRAVFFATLSYVAFFFADYRWISGDFLGATVHLVLFLAVVKLFTAETPRDFVYLEILAFLEILAAALLSANATFFLALALFLFCAVAAFSSGEILRSARGLAQPVRSDPRSAFRLAALAAGITGGIVVLTSVFFFLLPRTARAAFRHLVPARLHITGFANEIALGRIGEIQQRPTPVMHVRAFAGNGQLPPLRWRGQALRDFDGRTWSTPAEAGEILRPDRGLIRLAENEQRWRAGRRVAYEVHLQAVSGDTLFVAGTPEFIQIDSPFVVRTAARSLRTGFNVRDGVRYGVYAYLDDRYAAPSESTPLSAEARVRHLLLPPVDPRVVELARTLPSPLDLERHLRTQYRYTLRLPGQAPADPIAHFLFERREGHCEYFASAMAVMLRINGIPSRVVTGFQGGVFNPLSGWHVLRAADAHSWVEAWINGRWVTFDPTPPDPDAAGPGLLDRAALWADALETWWRDWVLNYTLDQQLTLASRVEGSRFRFRFPALAETGQNITALAPWVVGGVLILVVLRRLRWARRAQPRLSGVAREYRRMLEVLRKRGFEKPPWQTPREFARSLPDQPWRAEVTAITDAYYRARFGHEPVSLGFLRERIKQL